MNMKKTLMFFLITKKMLNKNVNNIEYMQRRKYNSL